MRFVEGLLLAAVVLLFLVAGVGFIADRLAAAQTAAAQVAHEQEVARVQMLQASEEARTERLQSFLAFMATVTVAARSDTCLLSLLAAGGSFAAGLFAGGLLLRR